MSFLSKLFGQHVKNVGDTIMEKIVAFDPETASEAQIAELDEAFQKTSIQLAKARGEYDREQKEANEIAALYNQRMKAAEMLQGKLEDPANPSKTDIEASLAKLLALLEDMMPDVEREKLEADEAKEYLEDLTAHVEKMAQDLKQARSVLTRAQQDMRRAEEQKKRAEEKSEAAAVLAGIKKQGSQLNTALDVMRKRTDALKTETSAAETRAALLRPTKPEEDDAHITAAMREAAGMPVEAPRSLSERLAALKDKK
jgi:predicted house-cleaning NTP pyrophosphatase (Maf/HAM1 superfamily)